MVLKDELFNKEIVTFFSNQITSVYNEFDHKNFIAECVSGFDPLELKERMSLVRIKLEKYLPIDYIESMEIFTNIMKLVDTPMFIYGSVFEYIEKYGCSEEYLDLSLDKLAEFTFSLSAEFSIRPFLSKYPNESLQKVVEWSKSDDFHKRRLASEGTRPSLPWAPKITVPYKEAAVALDNLYTDHERYVTRSVANHLNDISKIDPDYVIDKLKKWKKSNKQNPKEMDYIINHSLRTLIKKGHPGALELLGYKLNPSIKISDIQLQPDKLQIGDTLQFDFDITSNEDVKLLIDYIIVYPTKHGKTTQKTYKLSVYQAKANKLKTVTGKRSFKELSTRKMRTGNHMIKIQVNGLVVQEKTFILH